MRILTRHVLAELLKVFLVTLAALTALIFVGLIGKEAVRKGLGLGPLVRMVPYMLPQAMQFAVPGTMLLATTSVYGRMSSSNEVVAIKSMGVSPWVLIWPTLALGTLVSFGAVLLNDVAVSWGRMGVQRVFVESIEEIALSQLRLHGSYSIDGLQISVRRVEENRLIQPTITWHPNKDEKPTTATGGWAVIEPVSADHKLVVVFHGLEGEWEGHHGVIPDSIRREFDLNLLMGDPSEDRSASNHALAEIGRATDTEHERLALLERERTAEAARALLSGDFERLSSEAWTPFDAQAGRAQYTLRRLAVEPYRRWASGFSCLCFVMVGAPLAILRQKGEFLASFFLCFLPILLVYYPLLMASVDQAKGGDMPPVVVWSGNAVLAVWGLWMMRRVAQH
ncbi:putative permease YjgP/YjgQ family protein [Pseudobythopirellula maris]|uniref:Putative permease YjgP/YjgQ family protein n=1 Tax=Pseudobythopirellula maris TaxID=2527991 RepID=A0A5C5ZHN6_9BACT|nr:LptF/LptG family permease [Pseudobythopirellula maris]TWT86929.1 putative permease YjgP/YjgQ family protein [Pseudobythopirellula maris]